MLFGDNATEKKDFVRKNCNNVFKSSDQLTIGVDFHIKRIELEEKIISIQLWEVGGEKRFRFLLPSYCIGASGAMLLYDVTNSRSLDHIDGFIDIIRQNAGDIPIVLIGSKMHLKDKRRQILRQEGILFAKKKHLSSFAEISSQNGQDADQIFQTLTRILFRRYIGSIGGHIPTKPFIISNRGEFIINRYLKLRLENDQTNIYVGGHLFRQCKYLMLNLPLTKIRDYDSIESIDEAAENLDSSMEGEGIYKYNISPETEYWAHCSNIQMWVEHDYATHLLHRNLAFPLLKALVNEGDPNAKKVFKTEIARRFESGYPSVVVYLLTQGYLEYLNDVELNSVLESPKFLNSISKWLFSIRIPKWLLKKLFEKLHDLNCPYCGIKLKESLIQEVFNKYSIKCKYCYTSLVQIEIRLAEVKKSVQKYLIQKSKTNKQITRATTIKAIRKLLNLTEDNKTWDNDIWSFAINSSKSICRRTTPKTIYFR